MKVRSLSGIPFEKLLGCFLLAFKNYFVEMPNEREDYQQRWKAAGVDFDYSYGMFQEEELIGFIIHAVDQRDGQRTAFNTGTGVIPAYRGQRIIQSIYQYALPHLKQQGVQKSSLEVITKNKLAIHLYEAVGFRITKTYHCFNGTLKLNKIQSVIDLEELALVDIAWEELPHQMYYSWDNQRECLLNGNYNYFQVIHENKAESFFILNKDQHYLAQFDLLSSTKPGAWERLFYGIQQFSNKIKINNVDSSFTEKLMKLDQMGLKPVIDQFEMEMQL